MIAEKVKEYGDKAVKDLIDNYNKLGLRASGRYAKELKSVVTTSGTKTNLKITGPIEAYFMENGRRPNKIKTDGQIYFLCPIIKQWAEDKGFVLSSPWMTAKKIVNEGITVPNPHNPGGVISDVINDQWFAALNKIIGLDVITRIESDVLKQFKS